MMVATIENEQKNSNGPSQVTINNADGSSTTTYYSGPNGTGTVTEIDQENPDGTSQITTYDTNGNTTTTFYSGQNGTGTITQIDSSNKNILVYKYSGTPFTIFIDSLGATYAWPLPVDAVSGSMIVNVATGPTPNSPAILHIFFTDGITTYNGPVNINAYDYGSITVDSNYNIVSWTIYVETPGYPAGPSSSLGTAPSGDGGTIFYSDGSAVTANSASAGLWSSPAMAVISTLMPSIGQTQQLSDVLLNLNGASQSVQDVTIAGSGVVELTGIATIPNVVVNEGGSLLLSDGILNTDPITIDADGNISGFGTATGDATINGTATAIGGTLDITGNISGSGTFAIDGNAALQLEGTVAATENLSFSGSGASLIIGTASSVLPSISGFAAGDFIEIEGESVSAVIYNTANGELMLTASTGAEFTLSLAGSYQQSTFGIVGGELAVFSDLDDPSGTSGYQLAIGINNSGTVVGSYTDTDGKFQAYVEYSGTFTTLVDPNTVLANGSDEALGINDFGVVVGFFSDDSGHTQGFVEQGGTYVTLSDPLAASTFAEQINNSDTIVGYYLTDGSTIQNGFVESNGVFTTLNDPNGKEGSIIDGINNAGQLVGTYIDASDISHGFVESGGSFSTVEDPAAAGNGTSAFGINDEGQIIGYYLDSLGVGHGFIDSNGSFSTIDDPNGVGSVLDDINNAGTIVGYYSPSSGGTSGFITSVPEAACFASGTRILVPRGEVAVEDLIIGDIVIAQSGQNPQIKWIGIRSYHGRFIADQHLVLPVCVKRDALAENVPTRDLWISPGHAIYIDGVLIPAWRLINGISIIQAPSVESVTYYHIELAEHDVIFADGCPAESFVDDNCRNQFQNSAEFYALYPDDTEAEKVSCFPRVEDGFQLQAIQHRLARRAGTTPAAAQCGKLRGFVDQAGPDVVTGWAQCETQPEVPVCLDVLVDGRRVARVLANRYRADLRAAGLGSGCHAFEVRLPANLAGSVEVKRAADQASLPLTEAALAKAA